MSIADKPRSGRPSTARNDENVEKFESLCSQTVDRQLINCQRLGCIQLKRKVPSKRQAVVDDDTKLNLLLALEENPITPARQLARDTLSSYTANVPPSRSLNSVPSVLCALPAVGFTIRAKRLTAAPGIPESVRRGLPLPFEGLFESSSARRRADDVPSVSLISMSSNETL
ncbi:hypothetical protein NQ318_002151 [Aromia moschata]|uniref:Uncharacterized protein n=1 Tax=Aromia moschata TaxID=1265417 RepID=A0AAV8XL82_9CUCU|nr:hypothetical protein NQ318_002151 [Aromia moschata]